MSWSDDNSPGGDMAPTQFAKNALYDKLMEVFGSVAVDATTTDEFDRALKAAASPA